MSASIEGPPAFIPPRRLPPGVSGLEPGLSRVAAEHKDAPALGGRKGRDLRLQAAIARAPKAATVFEQIHQQALESLALPSIPSQLYQESVINYSRRQFIQGMTRTLAPLVSVALLSACAQPLIAPRRTDDEAELQVDSADTHPTSQPLISQTTIILHETQHQSTPPTPTPSQVSPNVIYPSENFLQDQDLSGQTPNLPEANDPGDAGDIFFWPPLTE